MGVNKQKLNDVERRLRAHQPDAVEPPGWVTTRVLAGIEDAEPRAREVRPGWAILVGGLGIAVLVIGAVGIFRSGQAPSPAPDAPVRVASADPVEPADPVAPALGGPAIRISIPASFGAPAVFEREAGRLRRDAVQLADVVRKPLQRLGSGLRRF